MIAGQDRPIEQFASAWQSRKLHHAWLLAGPKGVRQAGIMRQRGEFWPMPPDLLDTLGVETADQHPIVKLVEAGSHPDMRRLERLVNEKTGNLNRNIKVEQIRSLAEFLGSRAALSPWAGRDPGQRR